MEHKEFGQNEIASPERFAAALNKQFEGYNKLLSESKQEVDELREIAKKQGESITKMKTIGSVGTGGSFADNVKTALATNLPKLEKGKQVSFDVKAITGSVMTAGVNEIALPFRQPEIDRPLLNMPFMQQLIPSGQTNSNTIDWLELDVKTDASATRDENGEIAEGNLEYIEKSVKLKNLGELMKVTEEALKDYSFLSSEINAELMQDLNLLLSTQLLSGDGQTTNIEGLVTKAKAFAAGDFESSIQNANYLDVIRVASNQAITAGKGRFAPNYAVVNPSDLTKMNLTKDTTGQYVLPGWTTDNGLNIAGVRIVANTAMTAGTYLVGDFTKAKLFLKDGLQIQIGWEGTDFKYNRVTVRGTLRAALMVKTNDEYAFVTGTFDTDVANLYAGA